MKCSTISEKRKWVNIIESQIAAYVKAAKDNKSGRTLSVHGSTIGTLSVMVFEARNLTNPDKSKLV